MSKDQGQRFEVSCHIDGERAVFGWSETEEGANAMVKSIRQNPATHSPLVVDRHSSSTYFVRDCVTGEFDTWATGWLAMEAAESLLDYYQDMSTEDAGWPEPFDIEVGKVEVSHSLKMTNKRPDPNNHFDYICDYEFQPTSSEVK